jgi:hypothetical protein
LKEI